MHMSKNKVKHTELHLGNVNPYFYSGALSMVLVFGHGQKCLSFTSSNTYYRIKCHGIVVNQFSKDLLTG